MPTPAWVPEPRDLATVMSMAASGATMGLIARQIGVDKRTLAKNEDVQLALIEGREIDEGLCSSRTSELMRQSDNLHVAASMAKYRLAVFHGKVEPKDGTGQQGVENEFEAEEEHQADLEGAREKLKKYIDAPIDLNRMGSNITEAIKTGNFTGDVGRLKALIASLEAPSATEVEAEAEDDGAMRYLSAPAAPEADAPDSVTHASPATPEAEAEVAPAAAPAEGEVRNGVRYLPVEPNAKAEDDEDGEPVEDEDAIFRAAQALLDGDG